MRIIVDWRNEDLGRGIAHRLEDTGSDVRAIECCQESGTVFDTACGDHVIPNIGLPGSDGFLIVGNIRACGGRRSIFPLTVLSDVMIGVHKSDAVAKDGLNRPFALKELESRLRALVRRVALPLRSTRNSEGMRSDSMVHRARSGFAHGQEIRLPPREVTQRQEQMRRQASSANELAFLGHTPATGVEVGDRVIDIHLSTLRTAYSHYGMSIRGQCCIGLDPATDRS